VKAQEHNDTQIAQKNLPKVRRISTLGQIRQFPPPTTPPGKPKTQQVKKKIPRRIILIGLVFFSVLGIELAIIYKYNNLNKRLYKIAELWKIKATDRGNKLTQAKAQLKQADIQLKYADIAKRHIAKDRNMLLKAYRKRNGQINRLALKFAVLQYKEKNYRLLLKAKNALLGIFKTNLETLQGNTRVTKARIKALKTQRDILAAQDRKKAKRIRELTTQLLNNIGEQELLVNKNIKLKAEYTAIKKTIARYKTR